MFRPSLLAMAVAALLAASSASATTVVLQDLDQAVHGADQIVHARVTSATPVEAIGAIWTDYGLDAIDWVKPGTAGRAVHLTIRQLGGSLGGRTMVAEGFAHFRVGDELVLFTKEYGGGWQSVQNVMQGAVVVQTQRLPTARGVIERKVLSPASVSFDEAAGDDLPAFEQRIRTLLAGGAQ